MKKFSVLTSVMFGFVAASLQAGTEVYKQVAPPPPPELYGLGFYGAIDAGANVFQNRGGDRTFSDDNPNSPFFGDTLTVSPKNDVGFRGGADFTLRDSFGNTLAQRDVTTWINTGAFMGNFIGRFAFGRFQPYAGAGVGIYYAESEGTEVRNPVTGNVPINTGGGQSHADLAWQIIAGSDY